MIPYFVQLSARHRADREFKRALRNAGIDESSLDSTAPALKNASRKSAAAANGEREEEAATAASAADEQRESTVRSTSIEGGGAVLDESTAARAAQTASQYGTAADGVLEDSLGARRGQTPDSDRSAQSTPRADAPERELDAV